MAIAMKTGKTRLAGRLPQSQANDAKEANMSQETEKPKNLRANTLPTDGFALCVDGKMKTRYETSQQATAAGLQLKQTYPVIQVTVYDAAARLYTPVELETK
jgi:hypothetical protein